MMSFLNGPEMRCVHSGKHFLVDFLAACPYDLLVKTAGGSVRYQAWVRIPKLLRLHRVVVWYQKKVQASAPFSHLYLHQCTPETL